MKTVIYGIGEAAQQLIKLLERSTYIQFTGFYDDFTKLKDFDNIEKLELDKIRELAEKGEIDHIILAIPSLKSFQKEAILAKLSEFRVPVSTLPTRHEMASDEVKLSDIQPIRLTDLIMREPFEINSAKLDMRLIDKVVLVSGGGGSIGAELCRQIAKTSIKKIIILDSCEYNLFEIYEKLRGEKLPVVPILADIKNFCALESIFAQYKPNYVFHAAAYKHVDLVEQNPLAAWDNNVVGTMNLYRAAKINSVESVTLVSTDKAVRPPNIMGATKRICELIAQYYASQNADCSYQTVRFGNVLGSSGSVIPIFEKQINSGGPVTVRHPEVTRYFMRIPEACSLILEVGVVLRKPGVFLLDMGKPVRILDLAKKLISLKGFEAGCNGIDIVFTGLRPGEKLHEELLIDEDSASKITDRIYRSEEMTPIPDDFISELSQIQNSNDISKLFIKYVDGYNKE